MDSINDEIVIDPDYVINNSALRNVIKNESEGEVNINLQFPDNNRILLQKIR